MTALTAFDPASTTPLPHVFLMPGGLHCAPHPCVVSTVLGSCVAVCLWDRKRRCSGINHYVLPRAGAGETGLRYGDYSISRLVDKLLRLGCSIENMEAKIFGGAAVLPTNAAENNVGCKNVELALERMAALGIPIVARRTGGQCGVSIRFFTGTGAVLARSIAPSQLSISGCG